VNEDDVLERNWGERRTLIHRTAYNYKTTFHSTYNII